MGVIGILALLLFFANRVLTVSMSIMQTIGVLKGTVLIKMVIKYERSMV